MNEQTLVNDSAPIDDQARQDALDTTRSFIVQAPAGSGKTELLTQRFLALLAQADEPEEIWAITFTRKAAAEMRRRIFVALDDAMGEEPAEAHRLRTWKLAKNVVRRDHDRGWDISVNPMRLQIFTIDSLCASLVRQMPILSGFGTVPNITNFADRLYGLAARRTLQALHDDNQAAAYVNTLLTHLDNNAERVETLLSAMLAGRDRWLSHVVGAERPELQRRALEEALEFAVESRLTKVTDSVPSDLVDEFTDLAAFAATHVKAADSPLRSCRGMDALPGVGAEHLAQWRGLVELLFTKTGQGLRKSLTIACGFPPKSAGTNSEEKALFGEMKERGKALLDALAEQPEALRQLRFVRSLPPVRYAHEQWQVFLALQELLKLAVAHLKVLFQETSEVDYTEVSHRALLALGGAGQPTDLALQLDYRLKHLLVDEFQDTARSQFDLVSGLIAGWQPGDERTLFLVGDPMQSIYRFREANVGLFLQARDRGINDVRLDFLQLQCNFRSTPTLVNWCNQVFSQAFPVDDDMDFGAVRFADAAAAKTDTADESVVGLHAVPAPAQFVEAELVTQLIREHQQKDPDASIAVLVRARNHLDEILPMLRTAGISYRALDLEGLREQPIVRDLFALTRALLHLGDRTAWLTVLRAPWCGLMLEDLHALAGGNAELTMWELCINESRRSPLSDDGQLRLSRIKGVLAKAMAERGRRSLRRWVEGTWAALGGPACVFDSSESRNAEAFFRLLEQADADGFYDDVDYLNDLIDQLKAADDTHADTNVQIMTIHKSKGLEFDTVIIPGMGRMRRSSDSALMRWIESTQESGAPRLMLAPIASTGSKEPIHNYLRELDKAMVSFEDVRLLYVAATRACRHLHLIGEIKTNEAGDTLPPPAQSFQRALWPSIADQMTATENLRMEETIATMARPSINPLQRPLYRVPSAWMLPGEPHPKPWRPRGAMDMEVDMVEFTWASETARHIGTVVHRVLQQIATDGIDSWTAQWNDTLAEYLPQMLRIAGVPQSEISDAARRCELAVRNTLDDERGRWILKTHTDARNEYELSGWLDGQAQRAVLDRTFVADGYRWIIDYKIGSHEGGTVDAFLDSELERYQPQLERYARIMVRLSQEPIKLALYFPLLKGWRAISAT